MKKQKKLVVGNWKMNPLTVEEAKVIVQSGKRVAKGLKRTNVVLCPPDVYISLFSKMPSGSLFLGAQDAFYEPHGSFTGEVSVPQLAQFGVSHVIVGHSEKRKLGETDEMVNKKACAVVTEDLTAIICVGEKTRDTHGDYLSVVRSQIVGGLEDISKKSLKNIVIAYEPVWAVGAPLPLPAREIHEMSIFIKKILRELYGILADDVPILYGGDVTTENAEETIRDGFVSGLLIGRVSLKPKDFSEIIKIVDSI